ncbi:MAG: NAD+ synthase [Rhodocyclaceae bacterium]|nr:NAD+ synthase [Rhodocyclaceae bacterium]MBL0076633.1 NAD+ synthase [Rhodocyclaceae bacterium]MBP6109825.1 NAD+ synthase [Rhodocyclaceae bacterium]MBP6280086.1 NAD+ synthase [Rhodocyclaceae bacterium]
MTLRIAIAQINLAVGDLAGNAKRILAAADEARALGADLLLTPELALCGYPPEDLLLRADFYRACARELDDLAKRLPLPTIVGYPLAEDGRHYNAASLLDGGSIVATCRKTKLPNYQVFDEQRYFDCGDGSTVVAIKGVRVGIAICEDIWHPGVAEVARAAGAELLLTLNASPLHLNKQGMRYEVVRARALSTRMPIVFANLVGGQDELIFDGASFALNGDGQLTHQMPAFAEAIAVVEFAAGKLQNGAIAAGLSDEAEVYSALQLGVRDYVGKNGFPGVIIGLSGGMDSALTLAIAVDALGTDKVRCVMMPSPYTAQMSLDDSREMVRRLGVQYDEIPIGALMDLYGVSLAATLNALGPKPAWDTTEENLQARIRGMLLMALSNRTGRIVLTTGNKSEMAVGYATLYGDMAGGFAVIKDVFKTFVYRLAHYRNALSEVIPQNIITRPPSAELKPGQTDQDSLPAYEVLDAIIEAYMELDESPRQIIARGFKPDDVKKVVGMLKKNEYKRRQSPVGIRVSQRGFGKDWRYPITSGYLDEY